MEERIVQGFQGRQRKKVFNLSENVKCSGQFVEEDRQIGIKIEIFMQMHAE
jgi:hypothetical protein